jgi:hypothetical protein
LKKRIEKARSGGGDFANAAEKEPASACANIVSRALASRHAVENSALSTFNGAPEEP